MSLAEKICNCFVQLLMVVVRKCAWVDGIESLSIHPTTLHSFVVSKDSFWFSWIKCSLLGLKMLSSYQYQHVLRSKARLCLVVIFLFGHCIVIQTEIVVMLVNIYYTTDFVIAKYSCYLISDYKVYFARIEASGD